MTKSKFAEALIFVALHDFKAALLRMGALHPLQEIEGCKCTRCSRSNYDPAIIQLLKATSFLGNSHAYNNEVLQFFCLPQSVGLTCRCCYKVWIFTSIEEF